MPPTIPRPSSKTDLRKLIDEIAGLMAQAQQLAIEIENRAAKLRETNTSIVRLLARLGNNL